MRSIKAFLLSLVLAAASLNTVHAGLAVRLFYPGYDGKYFAMPLYEPFIIGPVMACVAAVCYFVDDRGRTVIERGNAQQVDEDTCFSPETDRQISPRSCTNSPRRGASYVARSAASPISTAACASIIIAVRSGGQVK